MRNSIKLGEDIMKKLFTFLGTGKYENVFYVYDSKKTYTKFVQEELCNIVGNDTKVIVYLTKKAREKNWIELKDIFIKNKINYKTIDIFDGNNNNEIWENFNLLYEEIEEGDEIYIDVTHSFRSIPFIVISVLNYAKFIKGIQIKDIYYGAYGAKENDIAPIFNLSVFNNITDWTIGAEKFINTGDSVQLCEMINYVIKPILKETGGHNDEAKVLEKIEANLKDFSVGLYTVRGNKISEYGMALKDSLREIKKIDINELKPFEKILDKIYEKVYFYSGDVVKDIHNTVKLCRDLNLIQQAYTFLRENIVNYVCISRGLDIYNNEDRDVAEDLLHDNKNGVEISDKGTEHKLVSLFKNTRNYRNDLSHAGYRPNPMKYNKFKEKLDKSILEFERLIFD